MTIAAYVLTFGLALIGFVSLLDPLLGGLAIRSGGYGPGVLIGIFLGSLIGWFVVDLLWQVVEGGRVPLAALGLSLAGIVLHEKAERQNLNTIARLTQSAEMWAIVTLAIILAFAPGPVRWY